MDANKKENVIEYTSLETLNQGIVTKKEEVNRMEQFEEDLANLFTKYAQLGEHNKDYIKKADELLEGVKNTFSQYKEYKAIFNYKPMEDS